MVYVDPGVDTVCVRIPNHEEDWFNNGHGICEAYTDAQLAQTPWIEGDNTFHFARVDLTHPSENLVLIVQPDTPLEVLIQSGKYPRHRSFFLGYFFECVRREEIRTLLLTWGYRSSEIREVGGPCDAFLRSIWADFRILQREEEEDEDEILVVGEVEDKKH